MRKRILAILLTLAMMVSMMPSVFAVADPDNGMKVEWATTGTADVYKLVVSTSATHGTMLCNLILSYDNTKIVPINTETNAAVEIVAESTSDAPFTVTAKSGKNLFALTPPLWKVHGERTAFNVGTYTTNAENLAKAPGYVSQFEFYFKLKPGVTTSQFSNTTFAVEKKYSTTEPKSFLADFFSGNDKDTSGAQIQQADKSEITNACNGAGYADAFTVSLTYPNSTKDTLTATAIQEKSVTLAVPTALVGTSSTPAFTVVNTGADGNYVGDAAKTTWSITSDTNSTGATINKDTGAVSITNAGKAGSITITASTAAGGITKTDTATVTITRAAAVATEMKITGKAAITIPATGAASAVENYSASVTDQFGATMASPTVTWSATGATSGVTVADNKITVAAAATAGTVQLTAKSGNATKTLDVVISRAAQIPTTVEIAGNTPLTVPALGVASLVETYTATVKDQYGAAITSPTVTWSATGATTGVTVKDNKITVAPAATAGKVTLTAKSGNATVNKEVTISRAAPVATTVQIKRGGTVLESTDTIVMPVAGAASNVYTYFAKLLDQYGADMEGTPAWSNEGNLPTGVTVDNTAGTITVADNAAKGSLTLTATIGGVAATITVAVTDIDVTWTGVDAKLQAANLYTYGDKNSKPGALGNGTAKAGNVTLDGTFTYKSGEAVQKPGSKNITVIFKVTSEGAYKGIEIEHDVAVTIAKRPITVKLTDKTKVYGEANPALDFTITSGSLVSGDANAALAVTPACAATTASPAGTPVDITGTSAAADYSVTITAGKLTIQKAAITGTTTAAPAHTVLANDAANKGLAALKAIANAGGALPDTVTVNFAGGTAELPIVWANSADTYNVKGGVYTYKGAVTPGTNFAAYAPTLDAKMTVTPVNGTISKVDGAAASALKTPVTVAKAKASVATDYAALKLPASIELTFDGGVTAATYSNLTFSVPLDTLKAAAVDSTTKVSVTNIPAWVTIDPAKLAVDVKITAKYPVTVTVTPPAGVTYGTALGDPIPAQAADEDGVDTGAVTWAYRYEGKTAADVAYSGAEKPTQAGTYTVTATLVSTTHAGSQKSAPFTVEKKPLASGMIAVTGTYTYNTKPIVPTYTVTDAKLLKNSDYKAVIADNTNAGTAKITVTAEAKGNYSGTATANFTIAKAPLTDLTPVIAGTAQVGKVLTANLKDVADSELTWQWMRAGTNIDGAIAKTYTITAADSNKEITVKAVAASAGNYAGTSKTTAAVTVPKVAITGTVSIAITNGASADGAKIDATDTLTANITAMLPAEAQAGATYQWYRNGTAIKTATAAAYTVVAEDAAAVLKVVVTPAADFTGTAEASVEVGKTALTGTLTLGGTTAVGQTLTATYSDAVPVLNTDYTITWMRDGTAISGAGAMTYVITAEDQGKSITAKVTAKGATYTGELLSDTKAIAAAAPAAPAVTASAGDKQVTFNWTAPADNGAPVIGYVIAVDGGAAVTVGPDVLTYTVTGLTNGTECVITVAAMNSVGTGTTGTAKATPAEPYNPPTSGGSNTNTETKKNEDGSTTKTLTDRKTGNITATTTYPDGTKIVATTPKDGKTAFAVTVPKGKEQVTITLPMAAQLKSGEVAVIVRPDGTREVVKSSVATENGLRLTLTENAKLEIVDNSKSFSDIPTDQWFTDAVQFVASRELFKGTGEDIFSPESDTTRGMLITVLARFDGQDTTAPAGGTWYDAGMKWAMEQGISDGTNPDASITRESLAVMLYRYAKAEKAEGDLTGFTDGDQVSAWAADAMNWAVQSGILQGAGGKLNPAATASRAEVATMLQRYLQKA